MNKENCALELVHEIILYYDARSEKHKKNNTYVVMDGLCITALFARPALTIHFSILPTEHNHLHSQNKQRLSSHKNH